ncbi:hypothetical protein CBR_g51024 [Chara braunii]|uniref:Uncharacterized protein n=1 Tax=Chara braunii TaxID=69332 RepID=A0A388M817_CHABU|nr:hypothetical protein CBR_g51024 [Chara braunii]|eukprot:GBG90676.1 hypothetical protein CBR_g51024 [Chara braunii]
MCNFSEYLVELVDVEPLPFADEDVWELHQALYRSVVLGMFRFYVEHDDHNIGEHLLAYYVISRPKQEHKEGMVALNPFGKIGRNRPGLLELIHIELLSIAQVIASEEGDLQPRLRTASTLRRTYHEVVIADYLARTGEKVVDFSDGKPLRPPSSYRRPAAPKTPRKALKKRRRQPSPEAQGSRGGPGEEEIPGRGPVPESKATPIKGPLPGEEARTSGSQVRRRHPKQISPSPLLPDLNLDGAGPSAPVGGGGMGGVPYLTSRPPILAGPFCFRQPPRGAPVIDLSSSSELDSPPDRHRVHGGACNNQAQGDRGGHMS